MPTDRNQAKKERYTLYLFFMLFIAEKWISVLGVMALSQNKRAETKLNFMLRNREKTKRKIVYDFSRSGVKALQVLNWLF